MSGTVLLRGGTVHDGTGRPPEAADILVVDGRIAAIGKPAAPDGTTVIDAAGLLVAPGFIDVHSHSDYTLLVDPRAVSAIVQGVTSEVVGNCGHGCAPILNRQLAGLAVYGPIQDHEAPPASMAGYLDRLDAVKPAVNVVMLAPNGQLRLGAVGLEARAASPAERGEMAKALSSAIEQGAAGFSSGLEYATERGAPEAEVEELVRLTAAAGGIYATHTRDRDGKADQAVEEAIRTAERAGARLQIAHITPRTGEAMIARCLELSLAARRRGNPVHFDMHTRVFGFTHLKNVVPPPVLAGTAAEVRARLADPANRRDWRSYRNLISGVGDWDKVVLVKSGARPDLEGRSFAEIGRALGTEPLDAAIDMLAADADQLLTPMVILKTYTEDQLRQTYLADDCMVGSDATALAPDGPLANETFYGAYTWAAWFWRRMVRETRTFTPAEAIRKLTGLPAAVFGLADRGRLAVGARADIIAFDADRFGERGTVTRPNLLAEGMVHVLVNGVPTLRDGALTGDRGGMTIRGPRPAGF